jgi:hypothetical protein
VRKIIDQQTKYRVVSYAKKDLMATLEMIEKQQTSGRVDPEQWTQLGKMAGAQFICAPFLVESANSVYVTYSLLEAQSGVLIKTVSRNVRKEGAANNDRVAFESRLLAKELFGILSIREASGWHMGFQTSCVAPMGNFAELGGTGFGVSAFVEYVLPGDKGWALRARGEYLTFGEKEGTGTYDGDGQFNSLTPTRFNAKITHLGAMCDVVYYNYSGFYAFAGAGLLNRKNNGTISYLRPGTNEWVEFPGWYSTANGVGAESGGSLAVSVGGGWYPFNRNFGLEIKYTTTDASWIQASLCLRF